MRQRAAVIGAGLAGAAAARALKNRGFEPILFDKGRGPGGRLSTRRADTPLGEVRFDHGAQFVTAETDGFEAFLNSAEAAGRAAPWRARLISIDRGGNEAPLREKTRWVGTPAMNDLVKAAHDGLKVAFDRRVMKASGGPGAWTLTFEDGREQGPFQVVALTQPPEQLTDFLARCEADFADLIAEARAAVLAPCWTLMAALQAPFDPGFDGAKMLGGAIGWMASMNTRPGRAGPEAWVVQAGPDWSRAFLEAEPETVATALLEAAYVRVGLPRPVWTSAHRWRYAMVEAAPGAPFDLDASGTLGCAGDWRLGAKAEAAWTSGTALGEALGR